MIQTCRVVSRLLMQSYDNIRLKESEIDNKRSRALLGEQAKACAHAHALIHVSLAE